MSAETVEARAAIVTATVEIMGNFIIENMECYAIHFTLYMSEVKHLLWVRGKMTYFVG